MKYFLLLVTFLSVGCFAEEQSAAANLFDMIVTNTRKIFSGPFADLFDQAAKAFQLDEWKQKIDQILSQKATELSQRGQQEFEDAMKDLRVLKNNPGATKEDYQKALNEMKEKISGQ